MAHPAPERPARRLDASMDLLRTLQQEAVDPDYPLVAARQPRRNPWVLLLGLALAACLLTMAAVQTRRGATDAAGERDQLIARVQAAEQQADAQQQQVARLTGEVQRLQADSLPQASAQQQNLAAQTGLQAVTGPGIVVVVDDASDITSGGQATTVTDQDLRQLVNGLWAAGAEAVAVNGHRITARTAIRSAGSAITVDYRSLTHPYRVEAIGDPRSLASDFAASSGGQWWSFLKDNYRLGFEVTTSKQLTLEADPGLDVTHARAGQ
ncbi:DUF881 domain-containing protein [Luteococcus peritonei]|uniref:DUF881 domain-containing protein n=1 Tax=Luteococcus peritonei TaxID=88874 RepID=A0ABW4RWF2_9ACTN